MSEILSGNDDPSGRREPQGGWAVSLFVVIVVALLASGVFSSDPEPMPVSASIAPLGAAADPAAAILADEQADFVEFGFDSQFGVVPPAGEPMAPMPSLHPGEIQQPVRQM